MLLKLWDDKNEKKAARQLALFIADAAVTMIGSRSNFEPLRTLMRSISDCFDALSEEEDPADPIFACMVETSKVARAVCALLSAQIDEKT